MESIRTPFQGVTNIVRFNWHFYLLSLLTIIGLIYIGFCIDTGFEIVSTIICVAVIFTTLTSLLVSYFVYDCSDLYQLNWLDQFNISSRSTIVNISAGFDETTKLLKEKYPESTFYVLDFYDPKKHTEVSIKRARAAYPPSADTVKIKTNQLDLPEAHADYIFLFLAVHEIRDDKERIIFFKAIHQILKSNGRVILVEHLRDLPNFLAYNIGFFHFLSLASWNNVFSKSALKVERTLKITPFINVFILTKNGITH